MAKARSKTASTLCPCGSGLTLSACCEPYLLGETHAPTPESLMRSRYTAYALRQDDYVIATWAPETCPQPLFEAGEPRAKWLGLAVTRVEEGSRPDEGFVTFTARARTNRGAFRMTERSRFEKRDGLWLYVEGEVESD